MTKFLKIQWGSGTPRMWPSFPGFYPCTWIISPRSHPRLQRNLHMFPCANGSLEKSNPAAGALWLSKPSLLLTRLASVPSARQLSLLVPFYRFEELIL